MRVKHIPHRTKCSHRKEQRFPAYDIIALGAPLNRFRILGSVQSRPVLRCARDSITAAVETAFFTLVEPLRS